MLIEKKFGSTLITKKLTKNLQTINIVKIVWIKISLN